MSKTKPSEAETPKKRSPIRLALFALVPAAVLAGAGYGGWIWYAGIAGEEVEAAQAKAAGTDPVAVSVVPAEIAAETSFTHSFALASIIAPTCGVVPVAALKAASDEEARTDGLLVNLSWTAAARRTYTLDERTCRYFLNEVRGADAKAARIAQAKDGVSGH